MRLQKLRLCETGDCLIEISMATAEQFSMKNPFNFFVRLPSSLFTIKPFTNSTTIAFNSIESHIWINTFAVQDKRHKHRRTLTFQLR